MRRADFGDEHEVDSRLRQALEPSDESVERVVTKALATPKPVTLTRWKPALAAASLAVFAVIGARYLARVDPAPPPLRIEVRADQEPAFHITNTGGAITVTAPSGQVVAIVAGGAS